MTRLRVETATDTETGLIFVELYYPEDAGVPLAKTNPIYESHEEAERNAVEMFRRDITGKSIAIVRVPFTSDGMK